jgi:thiosulfate/3-mercaptopyruvate sulfurtransferase
MLDARAPERFRGEVPEPCEGLRLGHMPGAINVPFQSLLNSDGSMLSAAALTDRLSDAGVNLSEPIITSCGSGITAAIINLALDQIGHSNNSLYDGSWTEWGSGSMLPVVTGAD